MDLTPRVAALLPELRGRYGVVVAARSPDASYGRVGLFPGDVIRSLNRGAIRNLDELRAAVGRLQVGQPVVLQVERRGRLQYLAFEME